MKRKLLWILGGVPFLMVVAGPAAAQPLRPEPEVEEARQPGLPVGPGLWRLHGVDPTLTGTEDLAPLRRMVGKATVVGLGESWHLSGGFYKLKHRIFRDLVETQGFRVFAIETHWAAAEKANRYVQTCEGDPDEALDLHMGVWASVEVRELIQWMCEWNQAHPDDRVHYYGFDIQGPRWDGPGLIAFLGRIGIGEGHAWVTGINACENVTADHPPAQIPPAVHEKCMAALGAIEGHFERNARQIEEQTSKEDFDRAQLQLLSLKAWQQQVFHIGTDYEGADFALGFNKRDEAMAQVFLLLRDRHFPKAKAVIWAANIHIARAPVPNGARPIGSFLGTKLGRNYVSFAIAANRAELDYLSTCEVRDAAPGSIEERLAALGEDALLVDLAKSNFLQLQPRRVYEMGNFPFRPRQHFNGILFLETSERMVPTSWPACQE